MYLKEIYVGLLVMAVFQCGELMLTNMQIPSPPIEVTSVTVTTSLTGCSNVSVTYVAMETTQVVWTVGKGFQPQDLNPRVLMDNYSLNNKNVASICLPTDLDIGSLKLHLICDIHSFEIHLVLNVSHTMPGTVRDVKQYSLITPKSNEIGVSSNGEARFHVMVDTSGTNFIFGLLQTEATLLHGRIALRDTAYSFLPDNRPKLVRMKKYTQTETEYHADVLLRSAKLPKSKTAVSVSVACTHSGGLIGRLDTKHVLYIQRSSKQTPTPLATPLTISEPDHETLSVREKENVLLKCSSLGFPRPDITLYKKEGSRINPYILPSYTTSLQFEQTKYFQLLNASMSDTGTYYCKATNNKGSSEEKTFKVKVTNM